MNTILLQADDEFLGVTVITLLGIKLKKFMTSFNTLAAIS
jgi:hypothetical protein